MTAAPATPPKPLPRNLHPPQRRRVLLPGGKLGLAALAMTAASVAYLGWVAWGRYGEAFRKVFATNVSTSYPSRAAFFRSRLAEVERAGAGRAFVFRSPSLGEKALRARMEGDALVLDASDAKGDADALAAARAMPEFAAAGASVDALTLRFVAPRDFDALARAAAALFEHVLDGAPEGLVDLHGRPLGEIVFDDAKDR